MKVYDLKEKTEKDVVAGVGGFDLSADGKKILYMMSGKPMLQAAAAGGSGKAAVTKGMEHWVDLRAEWGQVLRDAWRLNRQYFNDPTMHGVDWDAVYEHYAPMIADCANREDVEFVIGEVISELNCGHAYIPGGAGLRAR